MRAESTTSRTAPERVSTCVISAFTSILSVTAPTAIAMFTWRFSSTCT
jgi:hypothetical protein